MPNTVPVISTESDVLRYVDISGNEMLRVTPPNTAVLTAQVTLTSAQLLALKAAPITIIAAPGAGKTFSVNRVSLRYKFKTTAYTINGGKVRLFLGAVANANPLFADLATGLLDQAVNTSVIGIPGLASTKDTDAHLLNVALLAANDGAAEFTLGDGTLTITVTYQILQP